jgi:hypothetical protein
VLVSYAHGLRLGRVELVLKLGHAVSLNVTSVGQVS